MTFLKKKKLRFIETKRHKIGANVLKSFLIEDKVTEKEETLTKYL